MDEWQHFHFTQESLYHQSAAVELYPALKHAVGAAVGDGSEADLTPLTKAVRVRPGSDPEFLHV